MGEDVLTDIEKAVAEVEREQVVYEIYKHGVPVAVVIPYGDWLELCFIRDGGTHYGS